MPELPEVETVVRSLRPRLLGKKIRTVHCGKNKLRKPWLPEWDKLVSGKTILKLERRGKWILINLSQSGLYLVVHLGMTGRLQICERREAPKPHTHLSFSLDNGEEELRYFDPRRFGSVRLCHAVNNQRFPEESQLGIEPFEKYTKQLGQRFLGSARSVKAILLDQSVVAGVGNIYADEALHRAGLNPERQGKSLTSQQVRSLMKAVRTVLQHAIDAHGSTILSFYYGDNDSGNFQNEFQVYGRTGLSCYRCGAVIKRTKTGGRSTHWCPSCQC